MSNDVLHWIELLMCISILLCYLLGIEVRTCSTPKITTENYPCHVIICLYSMFKFFSKSGILDANTVQIQSMLMGFSGYYVVCSS